MKFLFDLFPVILFFAAFKLYGIFVATGVAIVATFGQIGWVWMKHRKVEPMLWISLAIIVVFGGATLLLQDETFIKWKPTVLYWLFSAVLIVADRFFDKNLMQLLMGKQLTLPPRVWARVNLAWAGFFLLLGIINLWVAFSFPTDTWVNFKLFGVMGLMLVFVVLQGLFLAKYMKEE